MHTQYWIKDQPGTEERILNILSGQKPQKEKSRHRVMERQKTKTHKTFSRIKYFTTLLKSVRQQEPVVTQKNYFNLFLNIYIYLTHLLEFSSKA